VSPTTRQLILQVVYLLSVECVFSYIFTEMTLMPILIASSYLFGVGLVMAGMKWVGTPKEKELSKDLKVRHSTQMIS
jgi:hypothetical protein